MTKESSDHRKMILHLKAGSNFFGGDRPGGIDKFLLNKKNKPAMGFKEEYLDFIKWINLYSKIVDIREDIKKKKDDW